MLGQPNGLGNLVDGRPAMMLTDSVEVLSSKFNAMRDGRNLDPEGGGESSNLAAGEGVA